MDSSGFETGDVICFAGSLWCDVQTSHQTHCD